MKPIDEQNAVLLALHRAAGTPDKLTADLRAGGVAMSLHQVQQALARLERDGLVKVDSDLQVVGRVSRLFYSLTAAGRAEAMQLPKGN